MEASRGERRTVKKRIVTGLIGGALFIGFTFIGGPLLKLFILLIALVAMAELLRMNDVRPFSLAGIAGFLLMTVIYVPNGLFVSPDSKQSFFIFLVLFLLILTVTSKNMFTFDKAAFVILSALYVGFGFHLFVATREMSDDGLALVFFFLFLIWTTDTAAYFVGKRFGKHKLWPDISPNKTVEGALGGILSAVIIGSLLYVIMPVHFPSYLTALVSILIISVFGQVGDLVQSAIKRHYGVKDSGTILPGHGGLLDRFDSLIFVMVVLRLFHYI